MTSVIAVLRFYLVDNYTCVQSQCNELANITLQFRALLGHVTFIYRVITQWTYNIKLIHMLSPICQFCARATKLLYPFSIHVK